MNNHEEMIVKAYEAIQGLHSVIMELDDVVSALQDAILVEHEKLIDREVYHSEETAE